MEDFEIYVRKKEICRDFKGSVFPRSIFFFYTAKPFLKGFTRIKDRIFGTLENFLNLFSSTAYVYYKLFAQHLDQFLDSVLLTGSKSDFF
jgi:hypothetical protein